MLIIEALMGGQSSELLFTSPPYGKARDYKGADVSVAEIKKFLSVFSGIAEYLCVNLGLLFEDGEVIQYWNEYISEAKDAGLKLLAWNVWDKMEGGSIASATNMFMLVHEWIFVFGKKRKRLNRTVPNNIEAYKKRHGDDFLATGMPRKLKRNVDGSIDATTSKTYSHHQLHSVLSQTPEKARGGNPHPAIMRLEVATSYIEAMTDRNNLVIDPFLGSGTTLMACERLGRIFRGIEISPAYIAVCLQRASDIGLQPALVENINVGP